MARSLGSSVLLAPVIVGALVFLRPAATGAEGPVFKSGIDMVPLTVTVTDASGRYVSGLTAADFAIFEDNVPQAISFFAQEALPVDLAFVLDLSSSMRPDMPLVRSAAKGLVKALRDGDRGAVVAVTSSVGMPQSFTTDRGQVASAIDALSASGATAIYDGVYIALTALARERQTQSEPRRQVLVLLSDGQDNASHVSADDVSDLARRAGVCIYSIALKGSSRLAAQNNGRERDLTAERAAFTMRRLASDTGGRIFLPVSAAELPGVYNAIATELANQYDMAYLPTSPQGDGTFRRIAIRMAIPGGATARARSGYLAIRPAALTNANTLGQK